MVRYVSILSGGGGNLSLKVYYYDGCGTCRKAIRFLDTHGLDYQLIDIREKPPTLTELKKMLAHLGHEVRRLFNTSGRDYRSMNLKDKISDMSHDEIVKLMRTNGNLIRRPFVVGEDTLLIGFIPEVWEAKLL